MAIALDATSNNYNGGSVTSVTVSHTCTGSDRVIFAACFPGGNKGDVATGVTYNGVSLTQLVKGNLTVSQYLYWYGLVAPATGANNLVFSVSAATDLEVAGMSYTGVSQSGLPDATKVTTGTGNLTGTITTVADNCWSIIVGRSASGGPMGASTNVTARVNGSTFRTGDSNAAITPAGNYSQSMTGSGGSCVLQVSFAPSGATVTQERSFMLTGVGA